jgi:hypothetical protein
MYYYYSFYYYYYYYDPTTTILHIPTGVRVVGMEMDKPAIPMVIRTKEDTSFISDMGVVYSNGSMDESTMECLSKTKDTEGVSSSGTTDESTMECLAKASDRERYVLVVLYSLFGPFLENDQAHVK